MDLGLTLFYGPKGSEGDPDFIFFTLNICQATFIVTLCDTTAGIGKNESVTDLRTEGQADVKSEIVI